MSKFYLKNDFLKLRDQWYKKLKENGFVDKEHFFRQRKEYNLNLIQKEYVRIITSKLKGDKESYNRLCEYREYYLLCEHYLENGKFKSEHHKKIFSYHVIGIGIRKIVDKIKNDDTFYQKFSKSTIHRIIKYYISIALGKTYER